MVAYWGKHLEHELEMVGHKPSSEELTTEAARKRRLEQLLSPGKEPTVAKGNFMDPAAFFN